MKKILSILALAVASLLLPVFSQAQTQTMTIENNKTISDFQGVWTGASCINNTHPRFEQFTIGTDASGNPTVSMQFLKDDGTLEESTSASEVKIENGILVIKFTFGSSNDSLVFGLAFFQEYPNTQIGGLADYQNGGDVKTRIPTVLERVSGSIQDYATKNSDICSEVGGN